MVNNKFIVYLGYADFPYGLAEVQKMILIAKSLLLTGNKVTVICPNGTHSKSEYPEAKAKGDYDGIEYLYTSGSAFRNERFLKRRFFEVKGNVNEFLFLKNCKRNNKLDYAILSTRKISAVIYYSVISKVLGFKTILSYVEYYSAAKKKWYHIGRRINDKMFDAFAPTLVDAVFPISEFLISHVKEVSPRKRYFKIPVLTDFERYQDVQYIPGEKYFLFCGDVGYKEVIEFIIDSFERLKHNSSVYLYLVINGREDDMVEMKRYINNCHQRERIRILSRLTTKQLFTYYKNALALLIPLRPTFQDLARFPHKTGEYLASGNPVISTNYGEVKYYFKDMESMLLAETFDTSLFAEKMQFVIDNPEDAKEIGINGRNVAEQFFNFRKRAGVLNEFLNSEL